MAAEQKISEVSPLTFGVIIIAASLVTFMVVTGFKKMAPNTFGSIS
jgi:hypothetical protein